MTLTDTMQPRMYMNANAYVSVHGRQRIHVVHARNEAMSDEGGPGYETEYLASHRPTQNPEAHMETISVEAVRKVDGSAPLLHAFAVV